MQALAERDYFTDYEILKDPYSYFEAVRAHGPIYRPPGRDYIMVMGFAETLDVLKKTEDFSAVIGVQGAAAPLPFEPQGSDITAEVKKHQLAFLGGDQLVNYDDQQHSFSRSLLTVLFTPSRLRANEEFMAGYADTLVREAVARGGCELISEIATPFVTMVIADLLGVPAEDREHFMAVIAAAPPPGSLNSADNTHDVGTHPLVVMENYFVGYIDERRAEPRPDILSELANARFPDGSVPEVVEVARLASFLFAAGQDTSAKLLGNALRFIVDQPGLQADLRRDPALIPALIEEVLRLEGSTKQTARLARRDTDICGYPVPAGTKVMVGLAAANRDPRRWSDPQAFLLDRPKIKEHVAFGRGKHTCAGAPLARVEVRVMLETFLRHTSRIDIDARHHGPAGDRNLAYEASFIVRGLEKLHLVLSPLDEARGAAAEAA